MQELRRRELIRSSNNPVADYAEALVARGLGLSLGHRSVKGFDARDASGRRYEIKARRMTPENPSRQLSVIRNLDIDQFDFLVGVVFAEDFSVLRAAMVPRELVRAHASYKKHVNGWILHLRDAIWEVAGVKDVTPELIAAAKTL